MCFTIVCDVSAEYCGVYYYTGFDFSIYQSVSNQLPCLKWGLLNQIWQNDIPQKRAGSTRKKIFFPRGGGVKLLNIQHPSFPGMDI